jgi:hypothetical protein
MKMLGRPILKSVTLAVAISVFLIETAFSTPASNQTANEAAPLRLAALQCPGATDPIEITVEPLFGTINYRMGNTCRTILAGQLVPPWDDPNGIHHSR